jgi:acylphosphatase
VFFHEIFLIIIGKAVCQFIREMTIMPGVKIRTFLVKGKVQGVMFRQTLIRGAQKRKLKCGASNLSDGNSVKFTLEGNNDLIQEIIDFIKSGRPINNWNARIDELIEEGKPEAIYQVTTENVDTMNWNPNVEMYL